MEMKLTCPFCRAEHQSLHTVKENDRILVIPHPNGNFFRNAFAVAVAMSVCVYGITY